jgi:hypothetical protein
MSRAAAGKKNASNVSNIIAGGSSASSKHSGSKNSKVPTLADFVAKRDFSGALALLEFNRRSSETPEDELNTLMWM